MGYANDRGKRQCAVIRADAYTAAVAFRRAASLERDGLDPLRASAMQSGGCSLGSADWKKDERCQHDEQPDDEPLRVAAQEVIDAAK